MMVTGNKFLAAAAMVLGLAGSQAFAADLLAPQQPRVIPAPVEVAGGLYLRGDIGVGIQSYSKWTLNDGNPNPYAGYRDFARYHNDPTIWGVGLGYQFNEWLRADLTGEYRGAVNFGKSFSGQLTCACGNGLTGNQFTGQVSSFVGLVNGYVDIGSFWGLTPFVGAGIGFANNRVDAFRDIGILGNGGAGSGDAKSSTNFAWALHAGVAYTVNEALKLELSYRYLNLGDLKFSEHCLTTPVCPNPLGRIDHSVTNLTSSDVRLGMRWTLNPPPAAIPVAQPVIARN